MINDPSLPKSIFNPSTFDFHGIELVSFDFFDTLVFRDSVTHFQLWKNYSDQYFYARFKAEATARILKRAKGIPEISQDDIYSRMPKPWGLEFEMDLEQKSLSLNPVMANALIAAQVAGAKVCIISDTHFRANDIQRILLKFKIANVEVFTSGDFGLTKSTGLFEKVQSSLNVSYEDWVHIGDNLKSDIKSPYTIGIKAIYYPHMKHQLIDCGLLSLQAYDFLRKSGKSGNAAIAGLFKNLLLDLTPSPEEGLKLPELFGSVIGNLVSKAIAKEVHEMHTQNKYDFILYSSRDGWLPFIAHKHLFKNDPIVYFKTSRELLNDQRFHTYLESIVGDSKRVLLYDIGWRGTTAKKVTDLFPLITWEFVYWQLLGQKSPNQFELNPGGLKNRLRIWRSRDFLESVFTDESNGFDRIGIDLKPQERIRGENSRYKSLILLGATRGITKDSVQIDLDKSSLILESFARFPSAELTSYFEGAIHQVNANSKSLLITSTWCELFSGSKILWPYGSRLVSRNGLERLIFALLVFLKESFQRIQNLLGRLIKND
ncbi:HAD-IA family hydrolase [Polynucleobacter sp.]|uniref:HAD-IA family hydrolase n=1 Tax=Polynucleobacter sp. TaxID=2029855 RepID=UPI00333FEA65